MKSEPKIYSMPFSQVYPLYVAKALKKGRTKKEVDEIICWLTGYDPGSLQEQVEKQVDFTQFFREAPCINPNCSLIKGMICGVKIQEIDDDLMRKIRYLDKLVDELAKGRKMEKILRTE